MDKSISNLLLIPWHKPLPYTGVTPMSERRKLIKHMYRELDFTVGEIKKVYPSLSYKSIRRIVAK